jgi:hypothetical protein
MQKQNVRILGLAAGRQRRRPSAVLLLAEGITYCPPAAISSYEGPVVTRWPEAKDLGAKILERNGEGGADFMVVNSFTHQQLEVMLGQSAMAERRTGNSKIFASALGGRRLGGWFWYWDGRVPGVKVCLLLLLLLLLLWWYGGMVGTPAATVWVGPPAAFLPLSRAQPPPPPVLVLILKTDQGLEAWPANWRIWMVSSSSKLLPSPQALFEQPRMVDEQNGTSGGGGLMGKGEDGGCQPAASQPLCTCPRHRSLVVVRHPIAVDGFTRGSGGGHPFIDRAAAAALVAELLLLLAGRADELGTLEAATKDRSCPPLFELVLCVWKEKWSAKRSSFFLVSQSQFDSGKICNSWRWLFRVWSRKASLSPYHILIWFHIGPPLESKRTETQQSSTL